MAIDEANDGDVCLILSEPIIIRICLCGENWLATCAKANGVKATVTWTDLSGIWMLFIIWIILFLPVIMLQMQVVL